MHSVQLLILRKTPCLAIVSMVLTVLSTTMLMNKHCGRDPRRDVANPAISRMLRRCYVSTAATFLLTTTTDFNTSRYDLETFSSSQRLCWRM